MDLSDSPAARAVRHVLFDFGDTLAREPFCVIAPPGARDWEASVLATYAEDGLLDRWHVGEVSFEDVAARVATRCGLDAERTRDAMVHDWRNLRFNPTVLSFAREMGRAGRAAIVTVNAPIFTEYIATHYQLARDFPVVVTSWQERVLDKSDLCLIALERLGAKGDLAGALLVDNRADNVAAWRARGGQAYHFTDDATFARDLPALRARLTATCLRQLSEADFPTLFEQMRDPEAVRVAAFTSKDPSDRAAFERYWKKLLADPTVLARTILHEGKVAGSILKFEIEGKPEVTYWIGREHWGKGIATEALRALLPQVVTRPLYARAAKDNVGSIRVLEKCGFRVTGHERGFANARGAEIEEVLLELR
jgi:RimJ/RimL family protein N-acetyltransferase